MPQLRPQNEVKVLFNLEYDIYSSPSHSLDLGNLFFFDSVPIHHAASAARRDGFACSRAARRGVTAQRPSGQATTGEVMLTPQPRHMLNASCPALALLTIALHTACANLVGRGGPSVGRLDCALSAFVFLRQVG